jgi:hypothetical protein
MSSAGARPEVTRDNMGHANIDVTQNVYNKTWWEERVDWLQQGSRYVSRNSWFAVACAHIGLAV